MAKSVAAASVKKIIIACEAGMGSSLMAANKLKRTVEEGESGRESDPQSGAQYPRRCAGRVVSRRVV